jgi:hypothetical protein
VVLVDNVAQVEWLVLVEVLWALDNVAQVVLG